MQRLTAHCLVLVTAIAAAAGQSRADELPEGVEISGGDGTSCDDTVVIEAPGTRSGIRAEHVWLERHYPGHRVLHQSLSSCDGEPADEFALRKDLTSCAAGRRSGALRGRAAASWCRAARSSESRRSSA